MAIANLGANNTAEFVIAKNGAGVVGSPYVLGSGAPTSVNAPLFSPWLAVVGTGTPDYFTTQVKVGVDTSVDFAVTFNWFAMELQ